MAPISDRDGDIATIAADILAYLSEYPDAEDTLQGIVQWWLLEQRIRHQTAVVRRALHHLVASGMLIESRTPRAPIRYRMNKRKKKEIGDLLRGPHTSEARVSRGGSGKENGPGRCVS